MEPKGSLLSSQKPTKSETLCNILQAAGILVDELLAPFPTSKLEDHPLLAASN
jgi:hypothetical protein